MRCGPIQLVANDDSHSFSTGWKPMSNFELSSFHRHPSFVLNLFPASTGLRGAQLACNAVLGGPGSCHFVPSRSIAQQITRSLLAVAITAIFLRVLFPRQTPSKISLIFPLQRRPSQATWTNRARSSLLPRPLIRLACSSFRNRIASESDPHRLPLAWRS